MVKHISAESVNDALFQGLHHIARFSLQEESRNGPVLVSKMPVVTTYANPRNRVLINGTRDPNPFFHLFESMWMLAGRNDLAFPQTFVSTFGQFSDDGETLHGAYGYRWRQHFGYDQLEVIISELRSNPSTRRAVLQMWDGGTWSGAPGESNNGDLQVAINGGKDVPCNVTAFFDTIGGRLNLSVMCRSNDVILGAYGANVVHFSFLLEYMAQMTAIPMGVYRQFSTNFHLYTELYPGLKFKDRAGIEALAKTVWATDPYSNAAIGNYRVLHRGPLSPALINDDANCFHEDLEAFMEFDIGDFESLFFKAVVGPMYRTWAAWKDGSFNEARHLTLSIRADDWRFAAQDWLSVREIHRMENANV